MSSFSDRINLLKARAAEIVTARSALADRRKSYSLAASEGDKKAVREIADADAQCEALQRQEQTIQSAIEAASALEAQRELQEKEDEDNKRQGDAYQHAQAVAALNIELDAMLIHLRECFERRASLLQGLAQTEVADPALLMRLSQRSGPTSAAHCAGLNKYLHLEMTPASAQRPLADTNPVLLGIGKLSPSTAATRLKLRN